jgi:predicted metallo-beta-lactamase superfamily hydrolase
MDIVALFHGKYHFDHFTSWEMPSYKKSMQELAFPRPHAF